MMPIKFLNLVGNSFGCSPSGERLVSAARDGDLQEARALLEYNPRLARYSTFSVRNSPLHYSAAQGHHEIVYLLLDSGVDINIRNYRGQTALMQACQYGHWEVVLALMIFKANIHRADYLNGGTALHLAALNGHTRCIRLLLIDYIPSISSFCRRKKLSRDGLVSEFDEGALCELINRSADGGVTALHMAALNGHAEAVHLLLDLGASVFGITVEDGHTIDLIGAGSTPLHYAVYGGSVQCCQLLIAAGASLTTENANGWTPLMVAHWWHEDLLDDILTEQPRSQPKLGPSQFLCLPLMSIVKIARQQDWRGRWRSHDSPSTCLDPCVVCLERKCTVAAEGCFHEFCTHCALYLCSTTCFSSVAQGPPGSIPCPLCRHGIVSFVKLARASPMRKEISRTSLSLSICTSSVEANLMAAPTRKPDFHCRGRHSPSFRYKGLPTVKLNPSFCMGGSDIVSPCLVPRKADRRSLLRCSSLWRSMGGDGYVL